MFCPIEKMPSWPFPTISDQETHMSDHAKEVLVRALFFRHLARGSE